MASLNFNKSMLGGRITHDLELKTTQGGSITLAFSIAVQRKMDKNKTDFVNCKAFGKTAESIAKFLRKGSSIFVVGNIQTNNWQDKDGNKHYSTEVAVDEFYFVDSKNEVVGGNDYNPFGNVAPKFEEIAQDDSLPF